TLFRSLPHRCDAIGPLRCAARGARHRDLHRSPAADAGPARSARLQGLGGPAVIPAGRGACCGIRFPRPGLLLAGRAGRIRNPDCARARRRHGRHSARPGPARLSPGARHIRRTARTGPAPFHQTRGTGSMRLFIGGIATESNTFAPLPTGWKGFEEGGIFRGDATRHEPRHFTAPLHEWRRLGEADGHEVLEGLMAAAQPAGTTVRAVYESLRDALVTDLRNAMPVDVILLNLHGAMVAHGYDDCEGDLLAALRAVAGPEVIIGAELDLHCHLTSAMLQHADLLVAYKEYPHVDTVDRARELYRLALAAARGEIKPVTSVHDCRMIGGWHTTREPMAGFVRKMQALEGRDGVLSVSFGHGFAYGDVADVGARIWVITDNDPESGRALAARLGKELFDMRDRTRTSHLGVDDALDRALSLGQGPVVLADTLDNPGAGAAGDSTFILRRMLERGIRSAVS